MDQSTTQPVVTKPKRRFRFGLRGLIGVVLLASLALGLIAREDRRVRTQSAVVAELARMGIHGQPDQPTPLCFLAMKLYSTNNHAIAVRFSKWLDPGWFNRSRLFNAGKLEAEKVPAVVERISRLGAVKEVLYNEPPLKGLRLFFIDSIPYERLGVPKHQCTFTDHSIARSGGPR